LNVWRPGSDVKHSVKLLGWYVCLLTLEVHSRGPCSAEMVTLDALYSMSRDFSGYVHRRLFVADFKRRWI